MTSPLDRRSALRTAARETPAFSAEEHQARITRAQESMARHGLDLLVLFDPQSLGYFTGYTSVNMWDFSALVIPVEGEPRVVLWDFELGRYAASANLGDVRTYTSHADPMPVLAAALSGLPGTTYGVDDWTAAVPPEIWTRVSALVTDRTKLDARRVLWETRLHKSPAEIALLREVAAMTDAGVHAVEDALAEGVTDFDLAAAASEAMLRAGSEHFSIQPIVAIGPRAGIPHSESAGYRLRRGEGVFLEIGACRHRYTAPVMRTLVLGAPASDIARAGQAVIDADPTDILFHRFFGYPVGFGVPPSWLESLAFHIQARNDELLDAGMVFHVPLSLRHLGERGVGMSQTIEITSAGAVALSSVPARLIVKHD